jgi:molybdopterin molybdotransferase
VKTTPPTTRDDSITEIESVARGGDRMSTTSTAPDYAEALERALDGIRASPVETVALETAVGRVLRRSITADRDLPPCDRSRMDGYALRAAELVAGAALPVVDEVRAGDTGMVEVPAGSCVSIATGAPLPPGLDAVVEHERSDRSNPVRFELKSIEAGRSVHRRGSDARAGTVLCEAGVRLRAHHVGLLATVGCAHPEVSARIRVGVISSGDELLPVTARPEAHQIREGNAPMIAAVLESMGAQVIHRAHVPDEPGATAKALQVGLETCDLLVTIGGISAGDHDHIRPQLEALGVSWQVASARIKPGKPVHVGRWNEDTLVACLPGNPVSALVCAHLFCRPLVAACSGRRDDPSWELRCLRDPVTADPVRRAFRPARLEADGLLVVPAWQGSGDLAHLAECTGIVEIEPATGDGLQGEREHRYLDWRTV